MRELSPGMDVTTLVVKGRDVACRFVESITVDGERRRRLDRAAFFTVDRGLITSVKVYDERD